MINPTVIYEDKNFIVINKPAGLPVHGGGSVKGETLVDWLLVKYPEISDVGDDPQVRPGIVHRLDKETSGVMIIARTKVSFTGLKQLFQTRTIKKKYIALVRGEIKKRHGIIDAPIGVLRSHGVKRTTRKEKAKMIKDAVTEYRVLEKFYDATLVAVFPKTGRMHQIRVHFASLGHPIIGDRLYGNVKNIAPHLKRQFLHAASLEFSFPEGKRFIFEAGLPLELKSALQELRKS